MSAAIRDDGPVATLWLVRHGETEWSADGRHTSRTDLDLTSEGKTSARRLADRLAGCVFARVVTSPRQRARRTAALAGYPEADVLADLVEWDYGEDEGRTTAQIREDRPGWTVWADGPLGGETAEDVRRR
ncbi:MAG: histidine phosphatase family protein, partial [Actinomycetes bacterium]